MYQLNIYCREQLKFFHRPLNFFFICHCATHAVAVLLFFFISRSNNIFLFSIVKAVSLLHVWRVHVTIFVVRLELEFLFIVLVASILSHYTLSNVLNCALFFCFNIHLQIGSRIPHMIHEKLNEKCKLFEHSLYQCDHIYLLWIKLISMKNLNCISNLEFILVVHLKVFPSSIYHPRSV